ncbi:hypothetical protein ACWCSH_13220, partial [Streptosporangium sp. NPDC001682]
WTSTGSVASITCGVDEDGLQVGALVRHERIREALARHAGNVPVVEVAGQDTGVMDRVVTEAARLAAPGDTVLLAPAGASWDMFSGYPARGEAFARAVHRLAAGHDGGRA